MFEVNVDELCIVDYEIRWEMIAAQHSRLVTIISTIIVGLVALDMRGNRFLIGWGCVIENMVMHGMVFMWGPCMLGILYFHLHKVAYKGTLTINC